MTRYLCPVCRAPQKAQLKDELPLSAHFKIAISVSALCSIAYLLGGWDLAWRCAFFYLPIWTLSEFIHWVRMREATKCRACGFDPVLYQRDWKAARNKVETRLDVVVEELKTRGHFIPLHLRQAAQRGSAASANNEALASQDLKSAAPSIKNTGTRSVLPSSLSPAHDQGEDGAEKTPDATQTDLFR